MRSKTVSHFFAIVALVVLLFNKVTRTAPVSDDDEEDFEVYQILNEIDGLIRKQNNLRRLAMAPSPELIAHSAAYDDIKFTREQAEGILESLKAETDGSKSKTSTRDENDVGRRVYPSSKSMWPLPIPFVFDGTHSDEEKEIIREGISWWSDSTCIEFKEYKDTSKLIRMKTQYLLIIKGDECSTNVGLYPKIVPQVVKIGTNCVTPGIAAHEFGHVLGMWHEHMRPDREKYIKLNMDNTYGQKAAFAKVAPENDIDYGTGYDLTSIMHYDALGFSLNYVGKLRVFETVDPYMLTSAGQRTTLSFNDAKRINMHYKCMAMKCSKTPLLQPCQNGGYQDPKNCAKCRCPSGVLGDYCEILAGSESSNVKCGGVVDVAPCSTAIITSPGFPDRYPAEAGCSWHVKTTAGGLIFGQRGQPFMHCTQADTCIDYFEIRSNISQLDKPGRRFCSCGKSAGRIAVVDDKQAFVYFHSAPAKFKGGNDIGFELSVFATCGNNKASDVSTECLVTSSGYDYIGKQTQTDSGATCQNWAGQSELTAISFPDNSLMDAGNQCRNPDSMESPWCFTNRAYATRDTCSKILKCETITEPSNGQKGRNDIGDEERDSLTNELLALLTGKRHAVDEDQVNDMEMMNGKMCCSNHRSHLRHHVAHL